MRLSFLVIASAVLTTSFAARADTLTKSYVATGSTHKNNGNVYGIASSPFSRFDTSLGTLNSITIALTGTYSPAGGQAISFLGVTPDSSIQHILFSGSGSGTSTFAISASGTDSGSGDLSFFEGAGLQALNLNFDGSGIVNATGSLMYNYTPAGPVSTTPEPSSFALLGSGVLGIAGVMRRKFARG